jgi:hypothetical protein
MREDLGKQVAAVKKAAAKACVKPSRRCWKFNIRCAASCLAGLELRWLENLLAVYFESIRSV